MLINLYFRVNIILGIPFIASFDIFFKEYISEKKKNKINGEADDRVPELLTS